MLEPLNGFTTSAADFADKPNSAMSAAEVKAQFDAAPEELRVFVNELINQLNTDFALKSEIATALLGQILDGSLTDAKLSNTAGQVKDRLSKVITDLTNFISTKGVANGVASLDGSTKVPLSQVPVSSMVASSRAIDRSIPGLSFNNTTGANVSMGGGALVWFTFSNKSVTKDKGMRTLNVIVNGISVNTHPTDKGGSGMTPSWRIYVNGVLKTSGSGAVNVNVDVSDVSDGQSLALKVDLQKASGFDSFTYAYGNLSVSSNTIYDIM